MFVPNPNSTWHHWVGKLLTRNQSKWSFESTRLGRIGFGCVLIGFGFANLAKFWLKYGRISSDMAESNEIWPIFLPIYGYLAKISLDLSRSGQDHLITKLEFGTLGLPNFLAKLAISDRERISLQVGRVCQFLKQPNHHSNQQHQVMAPTTCSWPNHHLD